MKVWEIKDALVEAMRSEFNEDVANGFSNDAQTLNEAVIDVQRLVDAGRPKSEFMEAIDKVVREYV